MNPVPNFWTSWRGERGGMVISQVERFYKFAKGHTRIMCQKEEISLDLPNPNLAAYL